MKNEMIAKVLKELRKQNSLTVHDVVLKLSDKSINVADKTLYGWESGQAQPDADTLLVLCEIYQVDDILSTFGYKENTPINATEYEKKVIFALREHPEMASAVNKLLDIGVYEEKSVNKNFYDNSWLVSI